MKIKVPALNLQAELREIRGELVKRAQNVISSGRYILGKEVEEFERRFSQFSGTKFAVGVASGSDALLLSLMALGIGLGDEVITTPFSFISTVTAVTRLGAKPVFADVEEESFNLNPRFIQKNMTKRTRAILLVHLYGNPCKMDQILSIAKQFNLFVVEDCAQACGAIFDGKKVGSFGEFGAFSFYPSKTLGAAGDGGMITTNDRELYEKAKSLRHHGSDARDHSYRHKIVGINSRLDEVQAAILNVKLKRLAKWNEARRKAAAKYHDLFSTSNLPMVQTPLEEIKGKSVYHQYTIRAPRRNELLKYLHERGISAAVYYPLPLHLQPCFRYLNCQEGDFPVAEQLSQEVLSLPLYPQIKPQEQKLVVQEIKKFFLRS